MSEEFTQRVLHQVVGKICLPLGWHAMNSNAADVLADIIKQFILTLGRTTAAYSCHDNRSEPNLVDLSRAFSDLGVSLPELSEFLKEVRSSPLEQKVSLYPVPQDSAHIHQSDQSDRVVRRKGVCRSGSVSSNQSSEESEDEFIPAHYPPFPVSTKDSPEHRDDDDCESGIQAIDDHSDTEMLETTPTPLTPHDPSRGLPQSRPRLFSSDVSEDSGSRRSSISEAAPPREGALIRAAEQKSGLSNVFDSAFRHELIKSDPQESSKVEYSLKRHNLKRLSLSVDNVLLTQQQLSPLLSKIKPKIDPTSGHQKAPSPEAKTTNAPKDLLISTDEISIDELCSSPSPSNNSPMSHDTVEPTPLDESVPETFEEVDMPKVVNQETEVLVEADLTIRSKEHIELADVLSKLSENEESEFEEIIKKDTDNQMLEMNTPSPHTPSQSHTSPPPSHRHTLDIPLAHLHTPSPISSLLHTPSPPASHPHTPSPPASHPHTSPPASHPQTSSPLPSHLCTPSPLPSHPRTPSLYSSPSHSPSPPPSHSPSPPPSHHDTPSSLPSHPHTPSPPSHISSPLFSVHRTPSPLPSHPHTPSPLPSRPHTPSPLPSRPHTPTPPTSHYPPSQDLSDDNLSISDDGSTKSDLEDTKFSLEPNSSDIDPPSFHTTTEESLVQGEQQKQQHDDNNDIVKPEPVDVAGIELSFEGGGVSVEIGDPKNDSSEMINTLSAQVEDNLLETTKILEQDLSSDDESDQPVFSKESHDKPNAPTCLLMTNTEKVKGETKGRKRTVSKDDVLGTKKPKRPRKGSRKSRAKKTKKSVAASPSLVVSIKKALFEPPAVQHLTPPETTPTPPRPTTSTPLLITINRHLLRLTKFRLPQLTPEEKPKKSFEMLKIRLAKFGSLSSSIPKQQRGEFETTPTSHHARSRKRELDVSPSEPVFVKRPRQELQVSAPPIAPPLSSSSSSSSSDSDSYPPTPPRPTHITPPQPTHITPSQSDSDNESSSSSSSESDGEGVSSVGSGGGGLRLTISKAMLQQGGRSLAPHPPRPGGSSGWSSGKPAVYKARKQQQAAARKQKQGSKKRSRDSAKLLFSAPVMVRPPPKLTPSLPPPPTTSLGSDTICPVCSFKDDGSPMIGCDGCDDWCHWRCVGVVVAPPENEKWFCPNCTEKAGKKKKSKKTKR